MKKPVKYLTAPFLAIMFLLLVFKISCKKDEFSDEFYLTEKEEEITEKLSAILPNTFLNRLHKYMEEYSDHPDYEEYLNQLLDITSALKDTINKYYSQQEFRDAVEKFYDDFHNPPKSGIGCDIGNFGLGYAKGIAISADISTPISLEVLAVLENQYGGGIEVIYDFVNMTSQVYTYSLCGSGSDELSYELKLALSAGLGLTGYVRWFMNIPYMPEVNPNIFAGSSRTTSYHLSAELALTLGIGADIFFGKTQELEYECGFTYNLQQCEELQNQPPKAGGMKGITLGATAQGAVGASLAIGLSSNALGQCYNGIQASFIDYTKESWFNNRMGASLKMAANLLNPIPTDGFISTSFVTELPAAAAAIVYGFVDIEACNKWGLPHVLVHEDVEVVNANTGLYKAEGLLIDDGGSSIIEKGIALSTSIALPPYYSLFFPSADEGDAFEAYLKDLLPNHTYLVTAYAENEHGMAYGNEFIFRTQSENGGGIQYGEGVTDIDGNFYPSIIIGNQEWMAENLRTTNYADGTSIPTGLSNTEWVITTDGAYAIYPHEDINGLNSEADVVNAYGKLYNWYAVDDSRGLCPEGWRVPSLYEWEQLCAYIDPDYSSGNNNVGTKLKSCRQVNSPLGDNCNVTEHPRWNQTEGNFGIDSFGFSALPSGKRNGLPGSDWSGTYSLLGTKTNFYASTYRYIDAIDQYMADRVIILNWAEAITTGATSMNKGYPVRCIKD